MRRLVLLLIFSAQLIFDRSNGQSQDAAQLLLNYEKLQQLEEILDNMYKGYQILTQGYNRIRNIAEGNFSLHQVFLDNLYAVNPSIRKYKRIVDIINYQSLLVREYQRAYQRFKNDKNLTVDEIQYIGKVYSYLLKQSLRNLEELTMIITASKLRMSDEERIKAIDQIYYDMEDKVAFLRYFNTSTQLLIIQRTKENRDVSAAEDLHEVEE